MAKSNQSKQNFYGNGSWVAPAGVVSISAQVTKFFPPTGRTLFLGGFVDTVGNAWGMGNNAKGNLGNAAVASVSSPVLVLGGLSWVKVAGLGGGESGVQPCLGLANNGNIYGWGGNTNGQLGSGNVTTVSSPIIVVGGLKFSDFTTDPSFGMALALTPGGQCWAWGSNALGVLGNGTSTSAFSSPTLVVGGLIFQKVITSGATSAGLDTAGNCWTWGGNASGQLGDGTTTTRSSPVAVLGGLTFVDIVVASGNTTPKVAMFGITTAGDMYSWGQNFAGWLGTGVSPGTTLAVSSPVLVVGGLKFAQVHTGNNFGYGAVSGITTGGALYCWGVNSFGEVGSGSGVATAISSPTLVVGGLTWANFNYVNALFNSSQVVTCFGITTDGTMYAWGNGAQGLRGDGTSVQTQSSPVQVLGSLKWKWVWGAPGYGTVALQNTAYGMTLDGRVWSWGFNDQGLIGDGTITNRSSPVQVLGGLASTPLDTITAMSIPVVSGTTYSIVFTQTGVSFGGTVMSKSGGEVLTLNWET